MNENFRKLYEESNYSGQELSVEPVEMSTLVESMKQEAPSPSGNGQFTLKNYEIRTKNFPLVESGINYETNINDIFCFETKLYNYFRYITD